jgi:TRAP-type transport system periplasmic protein
MKKLGVLLLILSLLVIPLVGGCTGESETPTETGTPTETETPAAEFELSYSNFFPATHGNSLAAESWIAEIEARTEGRVKIIYYPGGTLTPAPQIYDGVVTGISDIGMTALAYTRGRFPLMEGLDLPVGYPSGMVASMVANDVYNEFQPAELADSHTLFFHAHGPGLLHSTEKVATIEDIKGLTIRSTGLAEKIVTALGGTSSGQPQGETFDALQKGAVQGTFGPIEVLKGWKQAEVVDYTTDCSVIGYTTTMWVGMNLDKWNAMPADIQQIFTEVSQEWIAVHGQVWDDADAAGRAYTLELGNEIIELDDAEAARWMEAVSGLPETYITEKADLGLPSAEVIAFIRQQIASYK